jgi:hypothetical protein
VPPLPARDPLPRVRPAAVDELGDRPRVTVLVGGHPRRRVRLVVVHARIGAFGPLDQLQHPVRREPARRRDEQPGTQARPAG